jgi:hypothetical protein
LFVVSVAYLLNDLMNSFADDIIFDLVMDATNIC